MATTDLKLDEPGSLPRPGPIGRLVRLAFGLLGAWFVTGLLDVFNDLLYENGQIRSFMWNGLIFGLFFDQLRHQYWLFPRLEKMACIH